LRDGIIGDGKIACLGEEGKGQQRFSSEGRGMDRVGAEGEGHLEVVGMGLEQSLGLESLQNQVHLHI